METSAEYFQSDVPAARSGAWVVEKIEIADRDYNPATDRRPDCFKFRPGVYTCLRRDTTQFMTDLYDEWWTQRSAIAETLTRGGEILITGMGLGLVAEAMLRPAESRVERITIVELSSDVIRLVAPYLHSRYPGKIEVIEADAFAWEPPPERQFTVGWHDIWPDPYLAGVGQDMERLDARYRSCCDWQGFWPKAYLEAFASP